MEKMTDKELLEKAAKAAGIEGLTWRNGSCCFYYDDPDTGREEWNPLADDGQALRLAVKLELDISYNFDKVEVTNQWEKEEDFRWSWAPYGDDRCAAVRRTIVETAAAIGRRQTT